MSLRTFIAKHAALFVALAVITLSAGVRLRLADMPLERDEGEYAYAGQLILEGVPPYLRTYNMKFPGVYYSYALIMSIFGQTPRGIRLGLLLVSAATALIIFMMARRLAGDLAAVVACAAFALLSVDRWIMGIFAHATHFVLLPAMAALLVSLSYRNSRSLGPSVASGLLLGTAVLMKQHAIFFLPLGVGIAAWPPQGDTPGRSHRVVARIAGLLIGTAAPMMVAAAIFLWEGVLGKCWFWTVHYARAYITEKSVSEAGLLLSHGFREASHATILLWVAAAASIFALLLDRWPASTKAFVLGTLVASGMAVCPGFYFRPHYFILLLPSVALLLGIGAASLRRLLDPDGSSVAARSLTGALFAALAATFVLSERTYLFAMAPAEVSRARYPQNPFVEAIEIARYIKQRTSPADRIMVLGSEPEIYFYADRSSASGYIYMYPLMEPQPYAAHMQENMAQEIMTNGPEYVVFVDMGNSWFVRPESNTKIVDWSWRYTNTCYDLVGVADVPSTGEPKFLWDQDAQNYRPTSERAIYTYRRKSAAPCAIEW